MQQTRIGLRRDQPPSREGQALGSICPDQNFLKCGMWVGAVVRITKRDGGETYEYYRCVERILNAIACTMPTIDQLVLPLGSAW